MLLLPHLCQSDSEINFTKGELPAINPSRNLIRLEDQNPFYLQNPSKKHKAFHAQDPADFQAARPTSEDI